LLYIIVTFFGPTAPATALGVLANCFAKVEFAAENFFLAKENAHFRAERDQVKGYLSEKEPQIIIIWLC
jgi:hypothetical protein